MTRRNFAYRRAVRQDVSIIKNQTEQSEGAMIDKIKASVAALTDVGLALLAFAIVASLLVGSNNMAFLGDVVGNITALVQQLGNAGLAGLISLGVVLWLFNR